MEAVFTLQDWFRRRLCEEPKPGQPHVTPDQGARRLWDKEEDGLKPGQQRGTPRERARRAWYKDEERPAFPRVSRSESRSDSRGDSTTAQVTTTSARSDCESETESDCDGFRRAPNDCIGEPEAVVRQPQVENREVLEDEARLEGAVKALGAPKPRTRVIDPIAAACSLADLCLRNQ